MVRVDLKNKESSQLNRGSALTQRRASIYSLGVLVEKMEMNKACAACRRFIIWSFMTSNRKGVNDHQSIARMTSKNCVSLEEAREKQVLSGQCRTQKKYTALSLK